MEIKCVCLGTKNVKEHVRCIELFGGKKIYLRSKERDNFNGVPIIPWKEFDDENVVIDSSIVIPLSKTRMTAFQCWPTDFKNIYVDEATWKKLLLLIATNELDEDDYL